MKRFLAGHVGFEPTISTLKGWRLNSLAQCPVVFFGARGEIRTLSFQILSLTPLANWDTRARWLNNQSGARGGIRTLHCAVFETAVSCQLDYASFWCCRRDSNSHPTVLTRARLPVAPRQQRKSLVPTERFELSTSWV